MILVAVVRPPIDKTCISTKRFTTFMLQIECVTAEFQREISAELGELDSDAGLDPPTITQRWGALSKKLCTVSTEVLGTERNVIRTGSVRTVTKYSVLLFRGFKPTTVTLANEL